MSLNEGLEKKMKKLSIYVMGLLGGLTPALAQAHAQLTPHQHSNAGYWLSLIPEILLVIAALAGVSLLIRRIKKIKINRRK